MIVSNLIATLLLGLFAVFVYFIIQRTGVRNCEVCRGSKVLRRSCDVHGFVHCPHCASSRHA
jgi:hypothetical protein